MFIYYNNLYLLMQVISYMVSHFIFVYHCWSRFATCSACFLYSLYCYEMSFITIPEKRYGSSCKLEPANGQ